MKVLHLSTFDGDRGAARAAYRLHRGLGRMGCDSSMICLRKSSDDPKVKEAVLGNGFGDRWHRRRMRSATKRDWAKYQSTRPVGLDAFSDDRALAGRELVRQLPPADLINVHWIASFLDYREFFKHVPQHTPVVWRMPDMHAFTGGCHYDNFCGKFTAMCGACPQLGSSDEHDLSRDIWLRKSEAFSAVPEGRLHLVATSRWIAGEARRSSLMGKFPVTIIPNGLDTEDFAPRDKAFARQTLGVPQDASIILFAADSVTNKRKGFSLLADALAGLNGIDRPYLLSIGGGEPDIQTPIARKHLGHISNDQFLSVIYSAADVFVIPSRQESFGQTVTESLSCGTPVVGFDVGGIPDMVRPGVTGDLAKLGDTASLHAAITRVLSNPAARAQMGANGRRIVLEEYSLEVQARSYLKLYESVIAASRNAVNERAEYPARATPRSV